MKKTAQRVADDVAASLAYAREHLDHPGVILFGQSMGAAAILRAVYMQGIEPEGVILEAVFDTMFHTVCNRFEVMHAPSFPRAKLKEGQRVFAAAPDPKTFLAFEGVGHDSYLAQRLDSNNPNLEDEDSPTAQSYGHWRERD